MNYSPPTKKTIELSLFILIAGISLVMTGYQELITEDIVFLNININVWCFFGGFLLSLLSWLIMYIGVRARGL
ncbi:MAG: hypothetical protein KGD63_03630 [Candidatus Lokiarchaeota archaeon]|nr:hypothetical protein [Candidatus Lokiarchaeota archaeon]